MEVLFGILLIIVMWKIAKIAFKATWGIAKIIVAIILFPLLLITMVYIGLIYVALILLLIAGVVALISR